MLPVKRYRVRKGKSVRSFKKNVKKTKAANLRAMPMRGGYRL